MVITVTFLQRLIPLILEDAYDNEDEPSSGNTCFSRLTVKVNHANYCMQPAFKHILSDNVHKVNMDPTLCQKVLACFYYEWMLQSNKVIMFSVLIFLILEAKCPGIYLKA